MKILNMIIEERFQRKQNNYLFNKLKTAKPLVNIKCPESYTFYKTQFHKNGTKEDLCKLNIYY